jgi:hypothetical protein
VTPSLLRPPQVRNRQWTKRETEKTIKEVWKGRLEDSKVGRSGELVDYVFQHFQKKVGIINTVIEARPSP